MTQVNLEEAKTQFAELVERAAAGEEIVIAKGGKPMARLGPLLSNGRLRVPGAYRGELWIAPDFDDLPSELDAAFAGPAE